jgi:hypothetical protein
MNEHRHLIRRGFFDSICGGILAGEKLGLRLNKRF